MGKGLGNALDTVGKVAGIVSPVAGIGFGIANMISGAKQSNDAKNALENYERQQLNNIAEGLQVSTLGADLQREEQARLASNQVQSAREGGARTMIGSLGKIQQGNQMVNRQIGADLDAQQKAIDQMRAEDEARIRAIQENREIADINALSSQINAGEQTRVNGISQGVQGLSTLGNALAGRFGSQNNYESGYTTSGEPTVITDANFQSPAEKQGDFGYKMDSAGQPGNYLNPFDYARRFQRIDRLPNRY